MSETNKTQEQERREALEELRALPHPAMDFTTPEGAILCLEDAMKRRDLDAAVACKDFEIEAVLLLLETAAEDADPELASDPKLVAQAAEVLELGYRRDLSGNWPNMEGLESFFIDRRPAFEDLAMVVVTEVSLMPSGELCQTNMLIAHRDGEWKVIHPVGGEEEEEEEA